MSFPPNNNYPGQYNSNMQYSNGNGNSSYQGYQQQYSYQINYTPLNSLNGMPPSTNQNTNMYNYAHTPNQETQQSIYHSRYQSPQQYYFPPPPPQQQIKVSQQVYSPPQQFQQNPSQQTYFPPQQGPSQQPSQTQFSVQNNLQHESFGIYPPPNTTQIQQEPSIMQANVYSPSNTTSSINIPPELNVPANPLEDCEIEPLYMPYQTPFTFFSNNQAVSNDSSFSYVPPPFSFNPDLNNGCCFLKAGLQPCQGTFYVCDTCSQILRKGGHHNKKQSTKFIVCENCARLCHKGHKILSTNPYEPAVCHCGSGLIEKNYGRNNNVFKCQIVPDNITSCIMSTNSKGNRSLFICKTCSKENNNNSIVCGACASICHAGHELDSAGFGCVCNCNDCKTCKLVIKK